jgi:xylulose-5-phosphate/fructose-6-phosphate phosphoketolase
VDRLVFCAFTRQDPGFIDHVVNKKAGLVRVYLPPDANCLLSVMDHCLRSKHYVNVVVAGKHRSPQWLTMDAAIVHCSKGIDIWDRASNDQQFDAFFTRDKPVIFAFHAYPWLIHRVTYRRTNHPNFHVRSYKEEGTITTAFDMTVLNDLDRFHLAMDVIDRVPTTGTPSLYLKQQLQNKLIEHKRYICAHGMDVPAVREWQWRTP